MFRVVKFGGSSLATLDRVKNVANITKGIAAEGHPTVLVVSAVGGITDQLIDCARTAEKDGAAAIEKLEKIKERHYDVYPQEMKDRETEKQILVHFEELRDILKAVSLIRVCSGRTMDYIVTYGERLNAQLMTKLLKNSGSLAEYIDAREIILTDRKHDSALI